MAVVTDQMILFWREQSVFSNFYPVKFMDYFCSEQYFMYLKAKRFGDTKTMEAIMAVQPASFEIADVAKAAYKCKKLGRAVENFDRDLWESGLGAHYTDYEAMLMAVAAKFSSSTYLRNLLKETGSRIIAEASPTDKKWGIGLDETNPDALDVAKWQGTNLLGKALMKVRSML